MKALKDIEVGDFYFKRKNYAPRSNDIRKLSTTKTTTRLPASVLPCARRNSGDKADAKKYYEQYLKILPEGPFAKDARASLDRLGKAQ